jgi:hypothetical protein
MEEQIDVFVMDCQPELVEQESLRGQPKENLKG